MKESFGDNFKAAIDRVDTLRSEGKKAFLTHTLTDVKRTKQGILDSFTVDWQAETITKV